MKRAVLIPREDDLVRFTVHILDADMGMDPVTGRINRTKIQVDKIKQVCIDPLKIYVCFSILCYFQLVKEIFQPYRIDFVGKSDWWGAYVIGQRLASRYEGGQGRVFIVGDACKWYMQTPCSLALTDRVV